MNLSTLKKFTPFEIALLALFVIYLVFPIPSPSWVVPMLDSPLGMLFLFAVAVALFTYKNPILGVLFIFVAYELLRRNHYIPPASPIAPSTQYLATKVPQHLPTQAEKNHDLQAMNPAQPTSLEEEVIAKTAPIGKSELPTYVETGFQPIADRTNLPMSLA